VATAACSLVSGMHMQAMEGLSTGRSPAAWNVIQAATRCACLRSTSASSRSTVAGGVQFLVRSAYKSYVCWYRAALQWTTVYGRSILGAYVPGGFHRDMQGEYSCR
jgi:hypothetical protein